MTNIKPQSLFISDKKELYKHYMPFIKNGGLFIKFNEDINPANVAPGQNVFILFGYGEIKNKTPIQGRIVWINKSGTNKGIGVALGDTPVAKLLRDMIKEEIKDIPASNKEITYTI